MSYPVAYRKVYEKGRNKFRKSSDSMNSRSFLYSPEISDYIRAILETKTQNKQAITVVKNLTT
jgi:hypothetical protein